MMSSEFRISFYVSVFCFSLMQLGTTRSAADDVAGFEGGFDPATGVRLFRDMEEIPRNLREWIAKKARNACCLR